VITFNPIPFRLASGSQAETRLKRYLKDRTTSLKKGLTNLHGMNGIIKWRKAYEATPATEKREFPWEGASNLVVPIVAIHSDTLQARLMSAVMKTKPLWVVSELGEFKKQAPEGLRGSYEEFLQYVGLEPSELDLYRVYHEWFGEAIRLGTSVVKVPWFKEVEWKYGPAGDLSGKNEWSKLVTYEGPRPEKLKYENFIYPVNAATIEAMDFKYDIIQLSKHQLEERKFLDIYDRVAVQYVLAQPDRFGNQTQVTSQKQQDAKVRTEPNEYSKEWDIYECHFKYRVDAEHFAKVIVWYHEKSDQILRSYYTYYPAEIYVAARLFYRDDMFPGIGFGEIMLPFQEEISEIHNQRRDNMTIANMKAWAVDPDSKLHKGFRVYPAAMVPAKQTTAEKEIEPLEMGTPVQGEIDSERLSLELAEKRSGVSPPMQGAGAGSNTKRGVYTAMGTLSLLQEGNTRTDLNITDIRYAHTRLGRLLGLEYATFGLRDDLKEQFGEAGEKIQQALEAIIQHKMALPVYASTASVNREVEKQSDLMMMQTMERYHQGVAAMLQAVNNPMMPPQIKQYTMDALEAARTLMKATLRHFGQDEVDRLVPEIPKAQPQQPQGGGQPGAAQGQPQLQPQGGGGGMPQIPQGPMPMLPGGAGKVM
jgi:hypothetical protein